MITSAETPRKESYLLASPDTVQIVTKGLASCKPLFRDPFAAAERRCEAARDCADRVPVAGNGDRRPQSLGEVAEVPGKSPQAKGHRVGTDRLQTCAHLQRNGEWLFVEGQACDSFDDVSRRTGWRRRKHAFEKRCRLTPTPGGPTRGSGDGNRARLSVGVGVRHDRRAGGLLHEPILLVGEVRAERRNAHRRSIAHRAKTAERRGRRIAPVLTSADLLENLNRAGAVSAVRIGGETPGEGLG